MDSGFDVEVLSSNTPYSEYFPAGQARSRAMADPRSAATLVLPYFEVSLDDDNEALESTLSTSYTGVRISGRLSAMLRGRYRKVKEAVTNEVRKVDGVTGVDVDLAAGTVQITSDAPLEEADVNAAIDEAGYEVRP